MGLFSTAKKVGTGLLDMDKPSRMARAKEQGFDTDKKVYHGTADDFDAFDPDRAIGTQFWSTTNKAEIESGDVGAQGSGVIKEMYHRIKNPAGWDEYDKFGVDELISKGYDGLKLPDGKGDYTYVAFDPSQYRSVDAAFDPAKISSSNLLASNPVATAAAGAGGLLAMTGSDDSYAGGPQSQYDPTSMSSVLGITPEMIEAMAQRDALDQQRMAADQQRYGQYADDQMMPREQTYSEQLGNYLSNLRYGDDSDKQQQEMARVLSGILDFTPVGSADALKLGAQQREAGNSFEGWLNSIGGAAEAAIPLAGLGYKYGKKRLQGLMERF